MRVSGPRSAVAAAFGSVSDPVLPGSLATPAVAVLPTSGRVAHPLSATKPNATTGGDLRTAYSAPADTNLGQGLAIATVQLSGWHPADLTTYGSSLSPQATPNYTAISVGGADPTAPDGFGGDLEVALDQETLLAVAPAAAQRAYFAPGDDGGGGFVAAVQKVADDAAAHHIAALSISWGACESDAGSQFMAAMDQALQRATAAGVSVFAASGDEGSADCFDPSTGLGATPATVDYPASSAYVVAVGGTDLPDPSTPSSSAGWSGSGGGESSRTSLPAWQQSLRAKSPHARRLVPDIASDADPATGIAVLDSVPQSNHYWWSVVGGTSLGAPTQAAMLASSLASAGWTAGGIGDVHPALYAAGASGDPTFTDVTTGSNGAYTAGTGYDLVTGLGSPQWSALVPWLGTFSLAAPVGTKTTVVSLSATLPLGLLTPYRDWSAPVVDGTATCTAATATSPPTSANLGGAAPDGPHTVSVAGVDGSAANAGTGTCHVMTAKVILDRQAPSAVASVRPASATSAIASWASSDPLPSSGPATFAVTVTNGGGTVYSATTAATSVSFAASAYRSYNVSVAAIDPAGNRSVTVGAHLYDDLSLSYGAGWTTASATGFFRSSRHVTTTQNAAAGLTGTGAVYVVYVTTCPTCGKLAAYNGNTLLKVVSLTTNRTHTLVPVTLLSAPMSATRTLSLRAAHASATATSVQIDAATIR